MHARGPSDTAGSSHSPRVKRRIRAKTSLAELERKERGRSRVPEPPRLRTLVRDPAEVPMSEGSLIPASSPTSGIPRAHPYTPVGGAVGSSSFEVVPSARDQAASDRGLSESMETVPITRANSSPPIFQDPSHCLARWACVCFICLAELLFWSVLLICLVLSLACQCCCFCRILGELLEVLGLIDPSCSKDCCLALLLYMCSCTIMQMYLWYACRVLLFCKGQGLSSCLLAWPWCQSELYIELC